MTNPTLAAQITAMRKSIQKELNASLNQQAEIGRLSPMSWIGSRPPKIRWYDRVLIYLMRLLGVISKSKRQESPARDKSCHVVREEYSKNLVDTVGPEEDASAK